MVSPIWTQTIPVCLQNVFERKAEVYILDTGDQLGLAFLPENINLLRSEKCLRLAEKLYAGIDVNLRWFKTGSVVSLDLQKFISKSMQTVMPWSAEAIHTITEQVDLCIRFWELKRASVQENQTFMDDEEDFEVKPFESTADISGTPIDAPDADSDRTNDIAKRKPVEHEADVTKRQVQKGACTHVVYNTSYKVAFVVTEESTEAIHELCKVLPDFTSRSLEVSAEHREQCIQLFHHRYFSDQKSLDKKIECYDNLFEAQGHFRTERDFVTDLLHTFFILDDDKGHKMKASVLFQKLANLMRVTDEVKIRSLNQRLPIYLLAAGLQKKRAAEGYMYFGIRERTESDESKTIDVETLTKVREKELAST